MGYNDYEYYFLLFTRNAFCLSQNVNEGDILANVIYKLSVLLCWYEQGYDKASWIVCGKI